MPSKKKKSPTNNGITTGPTREQARNGRAPTRRPSVRGEQRRRDIDGFIDSAIGGR